MSLCHSLGALCLWGWVAGRVHEGREKLYIVRRAIVIYLETLFYNFILENEGILTLKMTDVDSCDTESIPNGKVGLRWGGGGSFHYWSLIKKQKVTLSELSKDEETSSCFDL